MTKIAKQYLSVDPWIIEEKGYHPDRAKVSESIFSLGNEFMGVRGYFEEGGSLDRFVGSFFNGIFEVLPVNHAVNYKGLPLRFHFMVNALDWLATTIKTDSEQLDLGTSNFSEFSRSLDMREGILRRSLIWHTAAGDIKVEFERFLSMIRPNLGSQKITLSSINFSGNVSVSFTLDASTIHENKSKCFWETLHREQNDEQSTIMARTLTTRQGACSTMKVITSAPLPCSLSETEQTVTRAYAIDLQPGQTVDLERIVANYTDKDDLSDDQFLTESKSAARSLFEVSPDELRAEHVGYWQKTWEEQDVEIEGDPENQQGVRFGIFQLHQTYHGVDPSLNISAKGLTGEEYHGHTWWDTETYCLPFYIFNNPAAAKNLLEYRYLTLPQAKERALQKDCRGARYPMETIDGTESCSVWQHGDLEIHVSVAVAYGIWHYAKLTKDTDFLYGHGIEMLVEICRYYASRGGWAQLNGEYGFWCVMGPDEFHMMVHNNCYTNFMVKKAFEYTNTTLAKMKAAAPAEYDELVSKVGLVDSETAEWTKMADHMRLPRNDATGVYEQHDGYFDMPHLDVSKIPQEEFPVYKNWAYYRIFRTDMIKQPDVLLFLFFYSQEFSDNVKKTNFDFYESRCSHESSLSPGVHSILSSELGMHEKAYSYWGHAARLDLDDYNNNTHEGLHTTSMAAAWMNVIYGFGGMRSDDDVLVFNPSLPSTWTSFKFSIRHDNTILTVEVDANKVALRTAGDSATEVKVFGKRLSVDSNGVEVKMPAERVAAR